MNTNTFLLYMQIQYIYTLSIMYIIYFILFHVILDLKGTMRCLFLFFLLTSVGLAFRRRFGNPQPLGSNPSQLVVQTMEMFIKMQKKIGFPPQSGPKFTSYKCP